MSQRSDIYCLHLQLNDVRNNLKVHFMLKVSLVRKNISLYLLFGENENEFHKTYKVLGLDDVATVVIIQELLVFFRCRDSSGMAFLKGI